MDYLEDVYIGSDTNLVDFRFPVQYVIRVGQTYRGYAGQIASGVIRPGEEVVVLPSLRRTTVKSIDVFEREGLEEAFAPMSVAITLNDEIDIARGDMLVRSNNMPHARNQFEAMIVWMADAPLNPDRPLIVRHTTRDARVFVDGIRYKMDVNTLSRTPGSPLA